MDSSQFSKVLGEDTESKNCFYHPVKIKALRIDWMLDTIHGKEFLGSILTSEDLDHYSVETC